ncbi:DsrE family protein [Allohahella sp. A8]|uniref:DsrE family protein n=1 Tax=Allohahella sp. A8 TaxID=3141461 RepID=UPI003A81006F
MKADIRKFWLGVVVVFCALSAVHVGAEEESKPRPGEWSSPRIEGYGKVKPFDGAAVPIRPDTVYSIVFDVRKTAPEPGDFVPGLERVARFLNLAALAKVPEENLKLVVVLHEDAFAAALDDTTFHTQFGRINPNLDLLTKLREAEVEILVCGQALAHQKIGVDKVIEPVTIATAAVSVLADYQLSGYALIVD